MRTSKGALMAQAYRPFETIRLAIIERLNRQRISLEVDLRVGGGILSYNADDFQDSSHDLHERIRLNEAKKDLPANGTIYVSAYAPNLDFLNDYVLTLRDKQVVAIEGEPWTAPAKTSLELIPSDRQAEARALVHDTVKRCLTLLRRSKRFTADKDAAPGVRISFHLSRKKSYGGRRGLSFALNHYLRHDTATLREYASFASDPDIGSISGPWQTVVKALVCHELAHWAQYDSGVTREKGLDYKLPHGSGFREIYAYLRTRILKGTDAH